MPTIAQSETGDPLLLTPGPLTTSASVKAAMLHDWGSRDPAFIAMNAEVLEAITRLAGAEGSHATVPVQGSGTFAVEAMLTTLVPKGAKLLLLVNGAYGHRAAKIAAVAGRQPIVQETPEDVVPDLAKLEATLAADPAIGHVFVVHCETTSGILNPVAEVAAIVARAGRKLLVDSMSAFGALPIDLATVPFDALAASSNKCLEGVPGLGFVICRKSTLLASAGQATTVVLDLHEQHVQMEKTKQYRFTPPIHAIAALHQAIGEHAAEGGVPGRGGRYRRNCKVLIEGMRGLGFETLLPDALQAPIIVTFHMPADPRFDFQRFYDGLKDRGYVIYPGKLTVADSFRIGCIGRLDEGHMKGAVQAASDVLADMGVQHPGRRKAA